jgi:TonB family protein
MHCSNCGSPLDAVQRFCPKCGVAVQTQTPPPGASPYNSPYTPPQYTPPPFGGGPAPLPPPRKGFGCGKIILILLVILLIVSVGVGVAIYYGYRYTEKALKSSEPYTIAVKALKESPDVKEQMGEIVETGFPLGAFHEESMGTGKAAFVMSVKGSKLSGQYQVELTRSSSVWHLDMAIVRTANGHTIPIATGRELPPPPDTEVPAPPGINGAVSGGQLTGKAISLPKPSYPQIAKAPHASGLVVVQVVVDEEGNVTSARAISGHPLLRNAAEAAARGAKFKPTKLAGQAVQVSGTISYNFTAE